MEKAKRYHFRSEKLEIPSGELELLVGMDYAKFQPNKKTVTGDLALYKSYIKGATKLVVGGVLHGRKGSENETCCLIKNSSFWNTSGEELDTATPRSCQNCQNYKAENEILQENLKYQSQKKKWLQRYQQTSDAALISDTKYGAAKILESLEKRLQKAKLTEMYEGQIVDFLDRGVISKMSKEEVEENPASFYVPHNFVMKENSSTPLRIVTNSSYKSPTSGLSLNDITLKGPSSLNNLLNILLRFRIHKYAMVGDISKMYHSIDISEDQKYLRRILWRPPNQWNTSFKENPPEVYNLNVVTFGDRPAGCIATTALRNTARKYANIDPVAAKCIINDAYVDDLVGGGRSIEDVNSMMQGIEKITEMGGFAIKKFVVSGDKMEEVDLFGEEVGEKVLGIKWRPQDDTLTFKAKVNTMKKSRGKKLGPDLDIEKIEELSAENLTKRKLLRVVNSLFDPVTCHL